MVVMDEVIVIVVATVPVLAMPIVAMPIIAMPCRAAMPATTAPSTNTGDVSATYSASADMAAADVADVTSAYVDAAHVTAAHVPTAEMRSAAHVPATHVTATHMASGIRLTHQDRDKQQTASKGSDCGYMLFHDCISLGRRGPARRFCCEFNAKEGRKFAMDHQPAIKSWCATIGRLKLNHHVAAVGTKRTSRALGRSSAFDPQRTSDFTVCGLSRPELPDTPEVLA